MAVTKAPAASSIRSSKGGGQGFLSVHKTLYPNEVLFGTAFAFLDRCYVHLDVEGTDRIRVELTPRPGSAWTETELAGEFKNELVNQALRFRLAKQTEKVRTMIVGRAIGEAMPSEYPEREESSNPLPDLPPEVAKLLAEEEDGLDFLDDPLGIAVPWEEKYAKKTDAAAPAEVPAELELPEPLDEGPGKKAAAKKPAAVAKAPAGGKRRATGGES